MSSATWTPLTGVSIHRAERSAKPLVVNVKDTFRTDPHNTHPRRPRHHQRQAQAASFETKEGKKRTVELEADETGPSLRYTTAKVNKATHGSSGGTPAEDSWTSAPPSGSGGGFSDEPPF